MAPATATHERTALGELRPLLELVPSPLNPRKSIDKTKLEELAASIKSKGIIEPLIVRARAGLGQLEIVAGERRYRAAKIAGHDLVPVIIRTLSDVEVLELMAIENSQRDDLHPLEEADGYLALMKADPAYTPKAIAAKIGKSDRYVHQRLQLARLEPAVKKAFLANQLTAGHADLISRLKPEDQPDALKACFHNLFGEDKERGCISVRQLGRWIESNVRLALTADDPQTELFPEVAKALEANTDASKILQVAGSYIPASEHAAVLRGALSTEMYRRVQAKKDRCAHTQRAVVIIGSDRGHFIDVCAAKSECKTHWRYEIETAERHAKERALPKGAATAGAGKMDRRAKDVAERIKREKAQQAKVQAETTFRRNVLEQARGQIKKLTVTRRVGGLVVPVPGVLAVLARNGGPATWPGIVGAAVEELLDGAAWNAKEYARIGKILKGIGLDFAPIEAKLRATAAKGDSAQTSAKKAAKKS